MLNEVGITNHGKLAVLTIAAASAAAIVAVTSMTSSELTAAGRDTALALETSNSFSYFPGQYVNQATEASAHVQAF
jgi:hypothetical protein